jgi:3-hydroxybutyryl-CoA dehydrogenase
VHQQSPLAVIGAGTLGWQIALKFAFRGIEVRLQDAFPEALARGVALIEAEIAAVIDSGDSPAESIDAKSRIIAFESLASAVDGAWLVIEAIPERLELKRSFYAELSELVRPDVIMASNSSSYRSSAFADVTSHPERLMNAHFYGRAPAVELMTCGSTDPVNIERVRLFFESCGLCPFVCPRREHRLPLQPHLARRQTGEPESSC